MFRRAALILMAFWAFPAMAQRPPNLLPPVSATCISSPYGPRIIPNHPQAGTFHYGIDLPAPQGTPVRAISAGKVMRIQHKDPGGLEILIQHEGYVAIYSHLAMVSQTLSAGKQTVAAGEQVGAVGITGVSFGPHLYFGLLRSGQPVDPAPILGLSMCNGTTALSPLAILRSGGKLPPSRRYLDLRIDQRL